MRSWLEKKGERYIEATGKPCGIVQREELTEHVGKRTRGGIEKRRLFEEGFARQLGTTQSRRSMKSRTRPNE